MDKKLTQYRANGGIKQCTHITYALLCDKKNSHYFATGDTDGSVCVTTKKKRPKLASQGVETGSLDEEDCGAGSSAKTGKVKLCTCTSV